MTIDKKIRLILVNNLTASLFMASWFKQNKYGEDSNWENIIIYSCIDFKDDYSENIEAKKKLYEQANFNVFKGIINKWYVCLPTEYDSYEFNFLRLRDALQERKKRKKDLFRINKLLDQAKITPQDVKEIWSANTPFTHHFKAICKKAKNVFFEHGLSDVRYIIAKGSDFSIPKKTPSSSEEKQSCRDYFFLYMRNTLKGIHFKLNDFFEEKTLFFKKKYFKYDEHISIFGDEIKTVISKPIVVKTLDGKIVSDVAASIIRMDPCYFKLSPLNENSALILLESAKSFVPVSNKIEYKKYFKFFEKYCLEYLLPILKQNNIENIFFKSRFFHEENTQEGFKSFNSLNKNFNIFFLSDDSPLNYPVEFYLSALKPLIVIGAYSSGQFYAKKIDHHIAIYSYDEWFIQYCTKNFNRCFDDYLWLRPFFESNELNAFNSFIPKDVSNNF